MYGKMDLGGELSLKKFRTERRAPLWWYVRNFPNFARGWKVGLANLLNIPTYYGTLSFKHIKATGEIINYGVVGHRVVTTAFVEFVVDQLQTETAVFGDFKFHDSGVGVTAEAIGNTDIETTDGEARATGTQTENGANVYRSVGTIAYTTTKAITEHGLFNASTGVTLMDRTVFTAINVVNGDSIQFTYDLTLTAGS